MKTIATEAPTSHSSARCSATTPGAAVIDGRKPSAVAAYAITHSQHATLKPVRSYPGRLEHDPEKWDPVFRKDHAQTKVGIRRREFSWLNPPIRKGVSPRSSAQS